MKSRSLKKHFISATIIVGLCIVVPLSATAVQNIFLNGKPVAEIQMGGKKVCQIQHRGQVVYEDPDCTDTMQSFTSAKCNLLSAGRIVTLRDTRDGTYYRVKKMVDGNCWMVDNLALDLTADYDGKPSWGTAPVTVSGTDASLNSVPQQAQNNNANGQGQIPNGYTPKASYYYNWCAALADTSANCAASASTEINNTVINGAVVTTGTTTTQPEVTGICPAPFRLPKGGQRATSSDPATTANEFVKLDIAMGGTGASQTNGNTYNLWMGTSADSANWHGVIGGNYLDGPANQTIYTNWWTSTSHGPRIHYDAAYTMHTYTGSNNTVVVDPGNLHYGKRAGFSVRCVLNPSDPDLTQIATMQEMTKAVCAVTAAGTMKSLRDERDGTYYRVKKMVDGNCWMVDNLALNLTSSYTGKPSWATAPVTISGTTTSVSNKPQQMLNNNTANQGQIPNNGSAKASYLYNWCAALADTSSACAASVAADLSPAQR